MSAFLEYYYLSLYQNVHRSNVHDISLQTKSINLYIYFLLSYPHTLLKVNTSSVWGL
jgi:hypothetical protein